MWIGIGKPAKLIILNLLFIILSVFGMKKQHNIAPPFFFPDCIYLCTPYIGFCFKNFPDNIDVIGQGTIAKQQHRKGQSKLLRNKKTKQKNKTDKQGKGKLAWHHLADNSHPVSQ